jgi:truncated hemoglobin YjbI/CDGSH-type Zn-finger protein
MTTLVEIAAAGQAAGWPDSVLDLLSGGPPEAPARAAVVVVHNGPYLVIGPVVITDHLGVGVDHAGITASCRCGQSAAKPACDAACIRTGFDDAKSPDRIPDRRDTYAGQQVTIFDNRGLCQHSGLCTDRLAAVFHTGSEPFVTPSGGRMDEIVRAVRDCPSGALSYGIDEVEARRQVDWNGSRPATITITADGPYRLAGGIDVVDDTLQPVQRAQGASNEHCALCRCGQSQNKPFCSGMHWYVGFHNPPAPEKPTLFEWVGGFPALLRMTRLFYEKFVPADDLLGPLFANMSPEHPQRVAAWLGEVFGGPKQYSSTYGGYPRMLAQHLGKHIDEAHRARWVELLTAAAGEAGLPNDPEFRSVFGSYIEWGSRLAVENSQTDSHPPQHMPMPKWSWQTAAGPPGSRISALGPAPAADVPVVLPGEGESPSFARHIRTMFRESDQRSMLFAFDLWSYADVSSHAKAILARLRAGTMPCDGAWPTAQIEAFTRWIDEGTPS